MSVFDSVKHKIERALKSLGSKIEKGLKSTGHQIESNLKSAGHKIEGEIKHVANEAEHKIKEVGNEIEHDLKEIGEQIQESINLGVAELIELAEHGILGEALEKILAAIDKEISHGDAPIVLKTTYFDLEVTDAKQFARVIRDALNNGLPTSKSAWRHIIVDLAPVAVTPKVGIPLVSMVAKRIPLEDLERQALDKLLQEIGL